MAAANHHLLDKDTIVAIATPPGRGGIGILRLSGPLGFQISEKITGVVPLVRQAIFCRFRDSANNLIDEGLVIHFLAPHSFTGENVVELHTHGSPAVLDILIAQCMAHGARMARAGEFSERAFLNGKMDLVQAEAVADLIGATSTQAARSAVRSLQGVFSKQITALMDDVTSLRIYIEASLDFPEEEINFINDKKILDALMSLLLRFEELEKKTKQGIIIKEGLTVVIAGKPNAGKSSLLNLLAGKDIAIVSTIAGTTRDILREHIMLDGIPIYIIDTAGLREASDEIEQEGVRRACVEIKNADMLIHIIDSCDIANGGSGIEDLNNEVSDIPCIVVYNKADISGLPIGIKNDGITLSAKTGGGVHFLKEEIKKLAGLEPAEEHTFTARRRHLEKISTAKTFVLCAKESALSNQAAELIAEDLRQAQLSLSEITGAFTSDDLLGEIFSRFCIGK